MPRVVVRSPVAGEGEPLWISAAWAFAVEVADAEARYRLAGAHLGTGGQPCHGAAAVEARWGRPRPTDVALSPSQGFDLALEQAYPPDRRVGVPRKLEILRRFPGFKRCVTSLPRPDEDFE